MKGRRGESRRIREGVEEGGRMGGEEEEGGDERKNKRARGGRGGKIGVVARAIIRKRNIRRERM